MGDLLLPWGLACVLAPRVVERFPVDVLGMGGQAPAQRRRQVFIGRMRHVPFKKTVYSAAAGKSTVEGALLSSLRIGRVMQVGPPAPLRLISSPL